MKDNWAIILAAGFSTRMGTQKLLLPYNNCSIIESVIDNVLNSNVDKTMVVLGEDGALIKNKIGERPVEFCQNSEPEKGMLSSVICGFNALPENANAALIFLGDQPNIPPSVTNSVINAYKGDLFGIVIPVHEHRRGHPLLVDMKYRREISILDLEKGLRALMHLFPEDVLEVAVDEAGILIDIDTREDYSNATKQNNQ